MDNASEVFSNIAGGTTVSYAQNPFDTNRGERGNSGIDFPQLVGVTFIYLSLREVATGFRRQSPWRLAAEHYLPLQHGATLYNNPDSQRRFRFRCLV